MAKKRSFEHESLQDRESIVAYLEALTRGLRQGSLKLSDGKSALELAPEGLLTLSVRASQKRNRSRLDLRISWTENDGEPDPGDLKIEDAG
jgi:amphi-Trp domain-containing protein